MDELRKIRIIYPPILCIASVFFTVVSFDTSIYSRIIIKYLTDLKPVGSLGLTAISFSVLLALGYTIGTVAILPSALSGLNIGVYLNSIM